MAVADATRFSEETLIWNASSFGAVRPDFHVQYAPANPEARQLS